MNLIKRTIQKEILSNLFKGKAIIITGARQVGKSTLVKEIAKISNKEYLMLDCDETDTRIALENTNSGSLKNIFGSNSIIIIDEAQRVENIGLTVKIIVDNIKDVQVIVTGSSSFEIRNKLSEPLTGRKFEYDLYQISFMEMVNHTSYLDEKRMLEQRLIYGYYPEVVSNSLMSLKTLKSIAKSYLYKDVLAYEGIRKPVLVEKILKALALQLGSEVSFSELSRLIGADKNTIEKYVDILEKAFIIFKLPSFSSNARNEIRKGKKYYFYDNGIRNAVINNFNLIDSRTDKGALWENFIISERKKYLNNTGVEFESFFWRTLNKTEIDYIEIINNNLSLYEIKWKQVKKIKTPGIFYDKYKIKNVNLITIDNFDQILGF